MAFFEFPHTRTYDSDLGWLIKKCQSVAEAVQVLEEWKETTTDTVADLRKLLDNIAAGVFPEEISNAIKTFIVNNFYDIVGDMTKMVWFGLTDSGYFAAYIPESWDDIEFFTTGYDYDTELMPEYGHLVLGY